MATASADVIAAESGPDGAKLITFGAMVMGMFMAVLDIQIVASSIGQIQAGLAASPDEISWVQSSYLIAEVLMIPLAGFFQRTFSIRYMFAFAAIGFALASLLCAQALSR
jgi:MFS transporter, DHA2 family, multidrug resistance protein